MLLLISQFTSPKQTFNHFKIKFPTLNMSKSLNIYSTDTSYIPSIQKAWFNYLLSISFIQGNKHTKNLDGGI